MRIYIYEVRATSDGDVDVRFTARFGNCSGRWAGRELPRIGNYDVELEIPSTMVWAKDIVACSDVAPSISSTGNCSRVVGVLAEIIDGVGLLRIGSDIVQVEISGEASARPLTVCLSVPLLKVFPFSL
jgi:hypothetical protein